MQTTTTTNDIEMLPSTSATITNYQPRTLKINDPVSDRRRSFLPAYMMHRFDTRPALLLLANVYPIDRALMEILSYSDHNEHGDLDYCPFMLEKTKKTKDDREFLPSFLIGFHRRLYVETSQRWKLPVSLIDYNLTRLRRCMNQYTRQVGESAFALLDELPMALEFYLQIDVDFFFMKTCQFRQAQPRSIGENNEREGLLCEKTPSVRYGIQPCRHRQCILCKSERQSSTNAVMSFSKQHVHRFVNGYRAILNCPATCDSSDVIYALTCLCGEIDYVGSTAKPFFNRIDDHREENHRIVREFLLGPEIIKSIVAQDKRKEQSSIDQHDSIVIVFSCGFHFRTLANPYDQYLYEHSTQCHVALQHFLDHNPIYWCFVPQTVANVKQDNDVYWTARKNKPKTTTTMGFTDATVVAEEQRASSSSAPMSVSNKSDKPMLFAAVIVDLTRTDEEASRLVRLVPDPPQGYDFSIRQRNEQFRFFSEKEENRVFPSHYVDLYHYSIVALVPDDCSRHLRQFIAALFATHAETKLNMIDRLTHAPPSRSVLDKMIRGRWCSKLVHPNIE